MKIARLYLEAYGAFSGRRLDFDQGSGTDFHVIYGPNEAGKSTTLRALTGLLFGIGDRTADGFLHPNPELRIGATLVPAEGARLSVMRRKGRKQTLFALDEATGTELTSRPLPETKQMSCPAAPLRMPPGAKRRPCAVSHSTALGRSSTHSPT